MRSLLLTLTIASLALATQAHAETKIYTVEGMHCGACVQAVTKKVCHLPGVESCQVEINKVTLTGAQLNDDDVKKAVDRAGYSVAKVNSAVGPISTSPAPHPSDNTDNAKKATK